VIANVIDGRPRDLGGVAIRRVLPDVAGGGQSVILVAWLFLVVH
jgi:hypothetical protein